MPQQPLAPLSRRERVRQAVVGLPVTSTLATLALAYNGWTATGLVTLRPFSSRAYRRWARLGYGAWIRFARELHKVLYHQQLHLSGHPLPRDVNALVIANHQEMADIMVIMAVACQVDRHWHLKWFAKDSLRWVPGPGWGMAAIDTLFVKRDWAKDREQMRQVFARLREDDSPLWVVSFPEGTRLRPDKLAESQDYARSRGWAVLQHLISPRHRGLHATLESLGDRLDGVLDLTIGYPEGVPTLTQFTTGRVEHLHVHVHYTPLSELPSHEEGRAAWLRERFQRKDELLEHLYAQGHFPAP